MATVSPHQIARRAGLGGDDGGARARPVRRLEEVAFDLSYVGLTHDGQGRRIPG